MTLHTLKQLLLAASILAAPGWTLEAGAQTPGTVEGRVVLEPPPPPRRTASRYPGGTAETRQIQDLPALVYMAGPLPGAAGRAAALTMAQRDTTFAPSVLVVPLGATVAFPNRDPFFHNVFSYSSAQRFDLGRYPQGESKSVTFQEAGIVEVFCEVHEFMRGAIVVTQNPFHAIVDAEGRFRITGVPPGEHTFVIWHPDHQTMQQRVVVTPGGVSSVEVELRR